MSNPYAEAVASHKATDQTDPKTGRTLCTCGKPASHRHIAAIGHAATRRAAKVAQVETPATVTLTREALVDLLTTAATIGRNSVDCTTRGDLADRLGTYGLRVDSDRLDAAVLASEAFVTAMREQASR